MGRIRTTDPCEAPGYVYVVGFDSGTVKIGRTKDAERRRRDYDLDSRCYGREITSWWASPLHNGFQVNELELSGWCVQAGGRPIVQVDNREPEWFAGLDVGAVTVFARSLTFPATLEALGAYREHLTTTSLSPRSPRLLPERKIRRFRELLERNGAVVLAQGKSMHDDWLVRCKGGHEAKRKPALTDRKGLICLMCR